MRRVIYQVAMSLDGYIAGPNGEYDWIVPDPDIDFHAMWARFDTLLMGRRTYELMQGQGGGEGGVHAVAEALTRLEDELARVIPLLAVCAGDGPAAVTSLPLA